MGMSQLQTPVALIIFRRPDFTARMLAEIGKVRPKKLLVVADGPSPSRPGEAEKCAAARAVIDHNIDWPCEVLKFYSDTNRGVRDWLAAGLNWIFEQCEEAIVLEDDDVPHVSFFPFCAELLERYRDDERVMFINGSNLMLGRSVTSDSYVFSRYFHCWGFASWRRAWKRYDVNMTAWRDLRQMPWLMDICSGNQVEAAYFTDIFDRMSAGEIPTWDYQVTFMMWANSGLAITPNVNLITNVGHGPDVGFYCKDTSNPHAFMPLVEMQFPLRHPPRVLRDLQADRLEYNINLVPEIERIRRSTRESFRQKVKRLLGYYRK
jgi:hypothetical protein